MKQASLKTRSKLQHPILHRLRETFVILGFFAAAYFSIALLTYHQTDPGWSTTGNALPIANAGGKLGAVLADALLYGLGYLAFLFPVTIAYFSRLFYTRRQAEIPHDYRVITLKIFSFTLLICSGTGLANMLLAPWPGMPFTSGGMVGEILNLPLKTLLNPVGTALLLWSLLLVGVSLFTGMSWISLMDKTGHVLIQLAHQLKIRLLAVYVHMRENKAAAIADTIRTEKSALPLKKTPPKRLLRVEPSLTHTAEEPIGLTQLNVNDASLLTTRRKNKFSNDGIFPSQNSQEGSHETFPQDLTQQSTSILTLKPAISDTNSVLPPLHLLDVAINAPEKRYSNVTLETMSREVELRLLDFGVQAHVVAVHPGPVITRFELSLAPGIKVSKLTGLAKDLARSLSVVSVRIVEIIPGKAVVGLEVPNEHREIVYLSEILSASVYAQSRSPLTLTLGKDISGHPVVVDLGKMPHLLVAGTTGSGKSVGVNVMLLSLLYKSPPEKVRMIMIDPKMLELSIYDGIPHLLTPVVTDMKDAANALRWCVAEMERRYRLMASLGVRNLAGYNLKIEEGMEKGTPILSPLPVPPGQTPEPLMPIPYIVVVIDEFADMMMVVGKKVEELIARIAQKARAAGIHMILATQRPSVDVITGLIKANIPTRIAFQVSSRIDSRTILDQQGAEQLLGHGDMLYLAAGTGIPVRVHGAYAADHEVHAVVNYIKQQGTPDYLPEILDTDDMNSEAATASQPGGEQDPLYDQAVQIVLQTRRASVSNVQRRLKIGYNRAARIVEDMEVAGIVSAMGSSGNREVLVESSEEML